MPVTAVADVSGVPKVGITISSPDGSAMTSIALYRVVGSIATLTRVQPSTGLASRYVEEIEEDWDTPVTYRADITYGGGATVSQISAPVTVSPGRMWALHPLTPSLSVPLDSGTFRAMGVVSIGDESQASTVTRHPILGSDRAVFTKTGPRNVAAGQMVLATVTSEERVAVNALLKDQTPLLIRVPAAWGWDWEDGFYQVTDLTRSRLLQFGAERGRQFTLAWEQCAAPAGGVQSTWSYPALTAAFADYPSMTRGFADYPALQANTRRA